MNALCWLVQIGGFGALWWKLTEGRLGNWTIGGHVVHIAAYLGRFLQSAQSYRLAPRGLARYLAFSFVELIKGGIDVAHRAPLPGQRTHTSMTPADSAVA